MEKIYNNSEKQESQDHTLATNLKRIRLEKWFTQKSLSEISDVKYTVITKIEIWAIREPSVYTCLKIAKALWISVEELIWEI